MKDLFTVFGKCEYNVLQHRKHCKETIAALLTVLQHCSFDVVTPDMAYMYAMSVGDSSFNPKCPTSIQKYTQLHYHAIRLHTSITALGIIYDIVQLLNLTKDAQSILLSKPLKNALEQWMCPHQSKYCNYDYNSLSALYAMVQHSSKVNDEMYVGQLLKATHPTTNVRFSIKSILSAFLPYMDVQKYDITNRADQACILDNTVHKNLIPTVYACKILIDLIDNASTRINAAYMENRVPEYSDSSVPRTQVSMSSMSFADSIPVTADEAIIGFTNIQYEQFISKPKLYNADVLKPHAREYLILLYQSLVELI